MSGSDGRAWYVPWDSTSDRLRILIEELDSASTQTRLKAATRKQVQVTVRGATAVASFRSPSLEDIESEVVATLSLGRWRIQHLRLDLLESSLELAA